MGNPFAILREHFMHVVSMNFGTNVRQQALQFVVLHALQIPDGLSIDLPHPLEHNELRSPIENLRTSTVTASPQMSILTRRRHARIVAQMYHRELGQ